MTIDNDDIDAMNARAYRRARMAEGNGEQAIPTAVGVFCLVHGMYDCPEPSCWRCGNHKIEDGRCADPRCRSTADPRVTALVAELGADSPVELLAYEIGRMMANQRAGGGLRGPENRTPPVPALPREARERGIE